MGLGAGAALEGAHDDEKRLRDEFAEGLDDGRHALPGSFRIVPGIMVGGAEVVGADVQNDGARRLAIQLAVPNAVQDVAGTIPAEAKVPDVSTGCERLPGFGVRGLPEMGDGVADHHDVVTPASRLGAFLGVPGVPVVAIVLQLHRWRTGEFLHGGSQGVAADLAIARGDAETSWT